MNNLELELRAIEALKRTLSGLVEHFEDRLGRERSQVIQEFNPEQSQIHGGPRAA